jgi:hypothetical protein
MRNQRSRSQTPQFARVDMNLTLCLRCNRAKLITQRGPKLARLTSPSRGTSSMRTKSWLRPCVSQSFSRLGWTVAKHCHVSARKGWEASIWPWLKNSITRDLMRAVRRTPSWSKAASIPVYNKVSLWAKLARNSYSRTKFIRTMMVNIAIASTPKKEEILMQFGNIINFQKLFWQKLIVRNNWKKPKV